MKLNKLLAAVILSFSLYSCSCEDVNLGNLEFTNELISFLPVKATQGKSYYVAFDGTRQELHYLTPDDKATVTIPVRKTNYSGKLDPNSCKEYYTAEQKVYTSQIEGENPVSITITYKKDVSTDRFNNAINRDNVGDVIEFNVGYNNIYPEPVPYGTSTINSFSSQRYFLFKEATTSVIDEITYTQEFLPNVILSGVAHENVYHLYIKEPHIEAHEPRSDKYPLDFVQGIYIKEGIGLIHAYTNRGKQIDVTIE